MNELSLSEKNALQALAEIRHSGKRIVFVSGTFNILHPGHLRLLRFARECGDYLVVGLVSDARADNLYINESIRLEAVRSVTWVNFAFLLQNDPQDFIRQLQPTIVVKGKEHEKASNPEIQVLASYGGKLLFGSGDTTFSSLDILQNEARQINFSTIRQPREFAARHRFGEGEIAAILERFSEIRVGVIGDTIIDEYVECDPLGMSQEDPTIVVSPIMAQQYIGGAAIVAAHAKGLGAKSVDFISLTGTDEISHVACKKLLEYQVPYKIFTDETRPTTLKQRFRARGKTLLRVNHLRQHEISQSIQAEIETYFESIVQKLDVLVFSDFSYGLLTQELVDKLRAICSKYGVMMVADSQCSSQIGDISRFHGMKLVTPTEHEVRIALGNQEDGLVVLAERLRQRCQAEHIIMTLGAEGVLIHATEKKQLLTDRIPALNWAPKDVAGAGDCLLISAAMALCSGASVWQSAYIGSLAAACQVGRVGNIPLQREELHAEIRR